MEQGLRNKSFTSPIAQVAITYAAIVASPIGKLGIRIKEQKLWAIDFLSESIATQPASDLFTSTVIQQLNIYFVDPYYRFEIPFILQGTDFQQCVWLALRQIPCGSTLTYGNLAKRLKSGARAIGNACRANPLPIIIPCHRIVAAQGIGGFAGREEAISIKRWLLSHEQRHHLQ